MFYVFLCFLCVFMLFYVFLCFFKMFFNDLFNDCLCYLMICVFFLRWFNDFLCCFKRFFWKTFKTSFKKNKKKTSIVKNHYEKKHIKIIIKKTWKNRKIIRKNMKKNLNCFQAKTQIINFIIKNHLFSLKKA